VLLVAVALVVDSVVVVVVNVVVVLDVEVREVVLLVVVVHPPSYDAFVPSPHPAHSWSLMAVAAFLM
jgi:hypothetical protein